MINPRPSEGSPGGPDKPAAARIAFTLRSKPNIISWESA
jgi:hypothetical protein